MRNLKAIWLHHKLAFLALIYLVLIPIFALIYKLIPGALEGWKNPVDYIYFSTITLTTLGYGDILPATSVVKIIASCQAVLGVVMIGLFLNAVSHDIAEGAREREIEKEKLLYRDGEVAKLYGFQKLIDPLISEYKSIVSQITSPFEDRKVQYNSNFQLKDMKDLFKGSFLVRHNFFVPAIETYYRSLSRLTNELSGIIKNIDTRLFPELQQDCLLFIDGYYSFDVSENILNAKNMRSGDESFVSVIESAIASYEGEVIFQNSNILTPYFLLYFQIKQQMPLILKIEAEINSIIANGD